MHTFQLDKMTHYFPGGNYDLNNENMKKDIKLEHFKLITQKIFQKKSNTDIFRPIKKSVFEVQTLQRD